MPSRFALPCILLLILSVGALASFPVLLTSDVEAQSFNCRYAKSADEVLICHDSRLGKLDEQMASIFSKVRNSISGSQQASLDATQNSWLRARVSCGRDAKCIAAAYTQRIAELTSLQNGLSPTTTVEFQRFPGKAFKYTGQDTFTIATADECERRCASDQSCMAFTYFQSSKQCRPMQAPTDLSDNRHADSGLRLSSHESDYEPPSRVAQNATAPQDTTYAQIGWWSINYVSANDVVGCSASSLFKDQTRLVMALGLMGEGNKSWLISISNPGWKAWINKRKQHTLRLVTTKVYQSTFFPSEDKESLYSEDLSVDFMNTIADATTLGIFNEQNKSLASLDMKDSADAIKAVVNCARKHAREVREARTTPQGTPQETPKETRQEETTFSGTGFFVAPNLVMTNKHVVAGCRTIEMRYPDQAPHTATISGEDSTNDVALLRTNLSGQSVASFRLGPRLGEAVATYGFPYPGILSSSGNFTLGNVTSMTGMGDDTRFLQMSTPIQPGNSGGPLLDMSGAVVGVVVAQLNAVNMMKVGDSVPENVNFAIHAAVVTNFLSIKGVQPRLLDTSRAAPQALSPADVADMAKKFTVRVICEGASPKMAKGDVPVAVVAHIMVKFGRSQVPHERGALSGHLATVHARHLLQSQWRRVNRENTP